MPRAVGAVACLAPGLEDLGAVAVAADRLARVVLADGACPGPCLLAQADQEVGGIGSIGLGIESGFERGAGVGVVAQVHLRSEAPPSELQPPMRTSHPDFCLKTQNTHQTTNTTSCQQQHYT